MPAIDVFVDRLGAVLVVAPMIVFSKSNKDHPASAFAQRDISMRRYHMFV
jgi:hypothetical protein